MNTKKILLNEQKWLTVIFAIGLAVLLIVRDIIGIELSKYVFVAYIISFFLIAKYEIMIQMLAFVFPLVCGLPGTYIMPCALILLIAKRRKVNAWQLGMIIFIATMELLASFWYPSVDFAQIIQYISFAATMFFLIHDDKCVDFYNCVRMFFLGTCILCLVIVIVGIRSAPNNWEELFADGYFRFGDTHSEGSDGMKLVLNANALAYYGIVGMSCGIMLAELAKTFFGKIFYVLLAVVCSLAGFLTVSRSWLIVTIICLIIYFAAKMRTLKGVFTVAICCMVLVLTVTKFIDANPDLFQGFITRFSDETVQDGGGRTVIMLKYMERFLQSPRLVLLGTGVTQTQAVIGISEALHNGTQQILVCYGFGGFAVYMVGLIRPIVIACRKKNSVKGIAWWLPIVTMMLFVQTIQFLNPMMQMLPFVVGIFAMKIQCTDCVTKQRKMERINSVVRAKTLPENGRRENL